MTSGNVVLVNRENAHGSDLRVSAAPGQIVRCLTHVPWCTSQAEFDSGRSLTLSFGSETYNIWQEHFDGPGGEDKIRFTTVPRPGQPLRPDDAPMGYRRGARGIGYNFWGHEFLVGAGDGIVAAVDVRGWVIFYPATSLGFQWEGRFRLSGPA
jgi:hypothetical protein